MLTLIQIELYKIFKKWRTYIGFIAIGVLVPIIHTAMVFEGKDTLNFMTRNIQQSFVFVGNLLNGYLVSYLILTIARPANARGDWCADQLASIPVDAGASGERGAERREWIEALGDSNPPHMAEVIGRAIMETK